MEEHLLNPPEALPKRRFYLFDARISQHGEISAKVFKHDTDLVYKLNDNIITMQLIGRIDDHVYESRESIYIIVDKSL